MEAEVWFSPGVVMEVLGDELTLSPVHTAAYGQLRENSGLAVRFPRFIRWRTDKSPKEATQVSEVVDMYNAQSKTV
jgi:DNA ligase-1